MDQEKNFLHFTHTIGLAKFTVDRNLWYKTAMRAFNAAAPPRPNLNFDFSNLRDARHIDLEIGAGQGLHAINYAEAHSDRTLLAVEKTNTRFARLEGRKARHPKLTNLHVFQTDAVAFVSHFLEDASLERVFLLYPNPYPKRRQANLRWHNRPFLKTLIQKMKVGASLTLATNMDWYAQEAREQMLKQWHFVLETDNRIRFPHAPRTHFEKKYLERRETCFDLVFRKSNDATCQLHCAEVE